MSELIKLAVNPPIQVGGSLFTPDQLARIGAILDRDAKIEMTSFKQLYLEVPLERKEQITEDLLRAGLEVNQAGFTIKSVIACNFCRGPEEAGLEIARKLNLAVAGIPTPTPLKIGYAGCALGTSEPLLKDIGIVKMRDTFDLYVGGEPKGLKATAGVLLGSGLTEESLVGIVSRLIEYYKANAKGKEKFSKFVNRTTQEQLGQVIAVV